LVNIEVAVISAHIHQINVHALLPSVEKIDILLSQFSTHYTFLEHTSNNLKDF